MKGIEKAIGDVKSGDIVKIHLSGVKNTLVGYVWYTSFKEYKESEGDSHPPFGRRGADLFIGASNPEGIDKTRDGKEYDDFNLESCLQLIGINTKEKTIFRGRIPVIGYEIIERAKK